MNGSWKTTSAGITALIGAALTLIFLLKRTGFEGLTVDQLMGPITTLIGGLGLIFAKDNNVTGGTVDSGKTPPPGAGPNSPLWALAFLLGVGVVLGGCASTPTKQWSQARVALTAATATLSDAAEAGLLKDEEIVAADAIIRGARTYLAEAEAQLPEGGADFRSYVRAARQIASQLLSLYARKVAENKKELGHGPGDGRLDDRRGVQGSGGFDRVPGAQEERGGNHPGADRRDQGERGDRGRPLGFVGRGGPCEAWASAHRLAA